MTRCPLTGIAEPGLLRASHILPWAECTDDAQRLDVHNGLLLSALWDAAFDRGLVSFADDGTPVFGVPLGEPARAGLRWEAPLPLTDAHRACLRWHRAHILETGHGSLRFRDGAEVARSKNGQPTALDRDLRPRP